MVPFLCSLFGQQLGTFHVLSIGLGGSSQPLVNVFELGKEIAFPGVVNKGLCTSEGS